jgi:hypothetical protein
MDARRLIAQMCSRFRVSIDFGRRLQPLVEKALAAADTKKRQGLLDLVERSFAEEGRRLEFERRGGSSPEEWRALQSVARMLHAWNPPGWFERWEEPPKISPF